MNFGFSENFNQVIMKEFTLYGGCVEGEDLIGDDLVSVLAIEAVLNYICG